MAGLCKFVYKALYESEQDFAIAITVLRISDSVKRNIEKADNHLQAIGGHPRPLREAAVRSEALLQNSLR